jgi:hypothetical protein
MPATARTSRSWRAVESNFTAILGREAAARRERVTLDALLAENRALLPDLAGLRRLNTQRGRLTGSMLRGVIQSRSASMSLRIWSLCSASWLRRASSDGVSASAGRPAGPTDA